MKRLKPGAVVFALACAVPNAHGLDCPAGQLIDESMPTGSRWEMCWNTRQAEGITFTDGHFTSRGGVRRKVFKELGISELQVEFDDDTESLLMVSGSGLGAGHLVDQTAAMCPGSLRGTPTVLCQWVTGRGYVYKYYQTQKQGYALKLQSISVNGPSTYALQWSFFDDGSIEPAASLTGELPAIGSDNNHGWPLDNSGNVGIGFTNHYTWRLDLDIGSSAANDLVEELSVVPSSDRTRKTKSIVPLLAETRRNVNADIKRSWRVRDTAINNADGRAISYHLEPLQYSHRSVAAAPAWRSHDLLVTAYDACERLPADNDTSGGCADSAATFVNGQGVNEADVVLWYTISYHHLPRSEDLDGLRSTWSGFTLVPRDWDATNPLGGS